MGKKEEIAYIDTVARVEQVSETEFVEYLAHKPYSDPQGFEYIMDVCQIIKHIPTIPARILDLGVGSGWTSEILARFGYEVIGLDICNKLIDIAKNRVSNNMKLSFSVHDYEQEFSHGLFDAVVIYDALHHCDDEIRVIENIYDALNPGGKVIIMEPGKNHSKTADSIEAMRKYGTTEKDMPFDYVKQLLLDRGFSEVRQYIRLRQLELFDLSKPIDRYLQIQSMAGMVYETSENGLTSLIIGIK